MLLKNITKKRDGKERIFCTTQSTFVTELRAYIVHDLKKINSSTTVVRIHLQFHPHLALHFFFSNFLGGAVVIILFNILTGMLMFPG
jgi:hypothetical protein